MPGKGSGAAAAAEHAGGYQPPRAAPCWCPPALLVLWLSCLLTAAAVVILALGGSSPSWGGPLKAVQLPPSPTFPGLSCVEAYADLSLVPVPSPVPCRGPRHRAAYATCDSAASGGGRHWRWSTAAARGPCAAGHIGQQEARSMLGRQWVAVAGDSVTRLAFGALLRRLASDSSQQVVFGHQDFEYTLPCGIRASFFWAPYADNVTALVEQWVGAQQVPDVLVMGTALWHMLHVGAPADYSQRLTRLADALRRLHSQRVRPANMFWFSVTHIVTAKLRTEQKRQQMTLANVDAYNTAIASSDILAAAPLAMVDVTRLTGACGQSCTEDGIHFSDSTYDAAMQVILNTVRHMRCPPGGAAGRMGAWQCRAHLAATQCST
mmetsp:Transcript_46244/g.117063  ORF Transcript_46244/g.117063 Transcript_46244/m.117063 type:complete len:378 (+) Transcript_46244:446-1579(+)